MSAKIYPPTELKLRKLRRLGVVPVSEFVLSAGVVLGVLLSSYIFSVWGWGVLFGYAKEMYLAPEKAALPPLVGILSGIISVVIFPCLLLGAIQSKFLFSLSACIPSLSKIFRIRRFIDSRRAAAAFLAASGWMLVMLLVVYGNFMAANLGVEQFEEILSSEISSEQKELLISGELMETFGVLCVSAASYAVFLAILSWFVVYLRFLTEHRMSKSELEAEIKEEEVSPEMRRRVRDLATSTSR